MCWCIFWGDGVGREGGDEGKEGGGEEEEERFGEHDLSLAAERGEVVVAVVVKSVICVSLRIDFL